ncbi:MAG: hypothetical protein Q9187_007767, partial [Circinaria calcarea]
MPARLSSMELSDPATSEMDATNRRRSGRATQKPALYQQDPNIAIRSNGNGKRKRAVTVEVELEDEDVEESSPDESEGDPDEEELKEKRKKASKLKPTPKKPAAKRSKTVTNTAMKLPMRPATNGVKKTPKPRKPRARQNTDTADEGSEDSGLYDNVAAEWISRYDGHNANAMCELVNFVLKCTGCDLQVTIHDIEDPDNVTSKLQDLQDEYQAQKITDYPLILKARSSTFSRAIMTSFFASLVETAHASGILYADLALIENIQVWVTTMSSSGIRPFRHTATVVSLSMASALCDVMKVITNETATTIRQRDGERKKKRVNKELVAILEAKIKETEKKREFVESWLRDVFDTVFVHRYRDVDPRIRVDCSAALGTWISTCPDIFFEGQYLRYLGWVLSDTSSQTRAEVLKQLLKLYKNKDNVGRLRAFTERFRPRMVEMAARDAESTIRASAIELLDLIRSVGLLEPDDVDTVGKLIFDNEPRVRKAVAGFFAENINDMFEAMAEELGGEDVLDEALGEEADDDYDNPRKSWLKLKCLAEVLRSYDSESGDDNCDVQDTTDTGTLVASGVDSRYSMAAQAICEGVPEIKEWEILAGYLLYDHSSSTQSNAPDDPLTAFKVRCQPNEREERLLLEILNTAVNLRLTDAVESEMDKKGKKSRAKKDESREIQETTALHLAQAIPRLLGKFGANPVTASAVLRLEHVLNLEIFQELRQDSTEYASLLDDINKQFLTHADHNVLAEASTALLHARSFEELEEVTESKVQELWDETTYSLRSLMLVEMENKFTDLCNTVRRISNLASISDCVQTFEAEPHSRARATIIGGPPWTNMIDMLLELLKKYSGSWGQESQLLLTSAMKSLLFYYMWKVRSLRTRLDAGEQIETLPDYTRFSTSILEIVKSEPKLGDVRFCAIGTLLDLHTLFATFRHLKQPVAGISNDSPSSADLVQEVPSEAQDLIASTFLSAEKAFAK